MEAKDKVRLIILQTSLRSARQSGTVTFSRSHSRFHMRPWRGPWRQDQTPDGLSHGLWIYLLNELIFLYRVAAIPSKHDIGSVGESARPLGSCVSREVCCAGPSHVCHCFRHHHPVCLPECSHINTR